MLKRMLGACAVLAAAGTAHAAAVSQILDRPVANLRGETVGAVEELIVDVDACRIAYVVVDTGEHFRTLPARALQEGGRVDMRLAGEAAGVKTPRDDPKYRRARTLLGQPITQPGGDRIGTIADIEFDPDSGRVGQVRVRTDDGPRNMPPAVLSQGFFPPLTRWQVEQPSAEVAEHMGFVRRPPAERRRLHDHEW